MKNFKFILCAALVLIAFFAIALSSCSPNEDDNLDQDSVDPRRLTVEGTEIVNVNGETVKLRGVNAGGWLIQEGWMCPTISDGSAIVDQKTMLATLHSRFSEEEVGALIDTYESSFWKEEDFDNIKALGLNTIRLPFWYMNLEDAKGNITNFEKLDWFIDCCDERDLYVILDLHGAYGSQNGKDHSGDTSQVKLFNSKEHKENTIALWVEVSKRYINRGIVAGYDLLNEPEGTQGTTGPVQWLFYKQIIEAIRENEDDHIIFVEGVWEPSSLPDPADVFPFANLVYEFHEYNWGVPKLNKEDGYLSQKTFIAGKLEAYFAANFGLPIFVGEFTVFSNMEAWEYTLSEYEKAGLHWTFWTYKVKGKNSSWGLYTGNDNLLVADISLDSYEEIKRKWSSTSTDESFDKNTSLISVLEYILKA